MQPKQFAIAKSSTGTIGLITSPSKVTHTYPDDNTVEVWTGVVLESNTFPSRDKTKMVEATAGNFWSSSNPEVIGYIYPEQMVDLLSADGKKAWNTICRENEARVAA